MAISARFATATRTTLTTCLCAALAAAGSARHADAALEFQPANTPRHAGGAPFARFALGLKSSASGAHALAISGNTIPVTNCLDDGSDGSLRKAMEGASDGDTIDMSGLSCSLITLQSGALVTMLPSLALKGPASTL